MTSGKKQYDDFLSMNVNNLKDYLTVRRISVSGYNKIELVARAYSTTEMDLLIILSSADLLKTSKKNTTNISENSTYLIQKILKKNYK